MCNGCSLFMLMVGVGAFSCLAAAQAESGGRPAPLVGMYVHQHWPYNHPYAARTWTVEDWRGYMDGLHRLGFNTLVIWPMLETMPDRLTPSDRENIEKIARVIEIAHAEVGMRVYLTISPNVVPDSAAAGQATFQQRHFFHCDVRVNPADADAVAHMMKQRAELLRPLAGMDGLLIIDSDPGGYPGSTNAEFVSLLSEHRKVLDRLRPGVELVYWIWAGWPSYARLYETGNFAWGRPEEFAEALTMVEKAGLEPWGIACTQSQAQQTGRGERVIQLQYGAIEGEPSFPITNFGGEQAYTCAKTAGFRGVLGNAQTHCVQLPNTFAFSRGATGKPMPTEADYVQFADDLIVGQGKLITAGWKMLAGGDILRMREMAGQIEKVADGPLTPGPLKGLLFGDARRFLRDLVFQLRYQAAFLDLVAAAGQAGDIRPLLQTYLAALEAWYGQHGYQNTWAGQAAPLSRLKNEDIDRVLSPSVGASTPFGRVKENLYVAETFTPRMIDALRRTLARPTPCTQPAGAEAQ